MALQYWSFKGSFIHYKLFMVYLGAISEPLN